MTSCPKKHEAVSFKIPLCSHLTPRSKKSDGQTCDWLVTRRWSRVDERTFPTLAIQHFDYITTLTVDDPQKKTSRREHDVTNDVYDSILLFWTRLVLQRHSKPNDPRTSSTIAKSKQRHLPSTQTRTTVFLIPFSPFHNPPQRSGQAI